MGSSSFYRCCFVQPEVSTATLSMPVHKYNSAVLATHLVGERICGAVPSAVTRHDRKVQLTGKMAPYVAGNMDPVNDCIFANIANARFVFICVYTNRSFNEKVAGMTQNHGSKRTSTSRALRTRPILRIRRGTGVQSTQRSSTRAREPRRRTEGYRDPSDVPCMCERVLLGLR